MTVTSITCTCSGVKGPRLLLRARGSRVTRRYKYFSAGPAETVGQVGHLPYHFLVVHTVNDVCYDLYPR